MKQGEKVYFKGTKSHGDSWDKMMSDSYFKGKTKDDMYGVIFAIMDTDIWVHIHDKKTGKLLDKSTRVFFERDVVAGKRKVVKYERNM